MGGRVAVALDIGSAAIMAAVFTIALATAADYGVTWDETWHLTYGDQILEWFLTLGSDRSALCYRLDFMYGGTYDLLGAVIRRLSPLSDIETIHRLGVCVGVLGIAGVWSLARRLAGPAAGFIAVALLATTSVYYGHMFNNPKDLPFAAGYAWALDALCAVVMCMPRVPRRVWIRFAVLCGLAMGVRIAGLLLLVYLGSAVIVMAWLRARATGNLDAGMATLRRLGRPALGAMAGAWVVMLLPWPWALLDPIRRPLMALGRMSRFTLHKRTMPFAGEEMLTTEPRWDYLVHYFGLKLPMSVLLLVTAAITLTLWFLWRHRRRMTLHQRNVGLIMTAAILAPPAYAVVLRSVIYDGLRHFLFLVPPIVAVAAVGTVVSVQWLRVRLRPKVALSVVIALGLGLGAFLVRQVQDMRRLHPHQYVYFNELAGGLPGAYGNYDTDYYGNSYREGFEALADYLWEHEREQFLESRYHVTGCIPEFVAANYISGNFFWAENIKEGAQFYLGYTRADCHLRYKRRPEMFTIDRMDTMLLIARDLRGVSASNDDDGDDDDDARTKPTVHRTTIDTGTRRRDNAKRRKNRRLERTNWKKGRPRAKPERESAP